MAEEQTPSLDKGCKLNWRQACRVIGCGKTQFYDLVNSGKLPAYRPKGCKRGLWVYEVDVTACIKQVKKYIDKN